MVKIIKGNLLDAKEKILVHQCNCKGVMGSGVAKQIREKYPGNYKSYKNVCKKYNYRPTLLGNNFQYKDMTGKRICNMFSQFDYGRDKNRVYTDYPSFQSCLIGLKKFMDENKIKSAAFPYGIGCGLANGDWTKVKGLIDEIFEDETYDIKIYQL